MIDARIDDGDSFRLKAALLQIDLRASGDRLYRHALVRRQHPPLRNPHRRRHRESGLAKGGRPEQMRHDRGDRYSAPPGRKKRRFVDVLDQQIETRIPDSAKRTLRIPRKGIAVARSDNPHPIDRLLGRSPRPPGNEQSNLVTAAGEAAENLVQVDLGSAGLRIPAILPIDDEEPFAGNRGFNPSRRLPGKPNPGRR